jgi:hypothetical protein
MTIDEANKISFVINELGTNKEAEENLVLKLLPRPERSLSK